MEVILSPDQQAFARAAISEGRLQSEAEAIVQALALWEDRERQRIAFLATLADAQSSLARNEGRQVDEESLRKLAADIKQRGRIRLASELARIA
jgi:Arc/MetJ-type ribon-helix-helix transcriptional regulator